MYFALSTQVDLDLPHFSRLPYWTVQDGGLKLRDTQDAGSTQGAPLTQSEDAWEILLVISRHIYPMPVTSLLPKNDTQAVSGPQQREWPKHFPPS